MLDYFKVGDPSWTVRRRIVIAALLFCAGITVWAAGWIDDGTRAGVLISSSFTLGGWIIGAYVFGAVVDDAFKRRYGASS